MNMSRRRFVVSSAAVGSLTVLPYAALAAGRASNAFTTPAGSITVHPVAHASFVMETPIGVIYSDPVGAPERYSDFPAPDLILVTHEHGDHFNADTLRALVGEGTQLITNPAVYDMLPDALKAKATKIANGESHGVGGLSIEAIPAYNTTAGRENFHPKGRDNGYVLGMDGFRAYISGDTEDTPEMRALRDIDLAFVCMNLPFTMDAAHAADAVKAFGPTYVYPYHYRGRDGGTQDPTHFAELVGGAAEVKVGAWYPEGA